MYAYAILCMVVSIEGVRSMPVADGFMRKYRVIQYRVSDQHQPYSVHNVLIFGETPSTPVTFSGILDHVSLAAH